MADNGTRYLGRSLTAGQYGRHGGELVLSERPLGQLIQITAWGGDTVSFAGVVGQLGLSGLPAFGGTVEAGGVEVFRLAPGRLWLRADDGDAALARVGLSTGPEWAALDLSHSRAVISASGAEVEELMARLVTVDCSLAALPPGRFSQTALHEVSVVVFRRSAEDFEIWVPVTWAPCLWSYVRDAAGSLGYRVATAG